MKVIDLRADYEVAAGDVTITNVIGNAQIGSSVVKLGNREIGRGDIEKLRIGSGTSLRNKTLKVKSIVTDVNDRTNKTSITYRFKGGSRNQDYVSSGTVDNNGDAIIYRAAFKFV